MNSETKRTLLDLVIFVVAIAFVLAILVFGNGCATTPMPQTDLPVYQPKQPIVYPIPK